MEWSHYFNVTDRVLDGSCYEAESLQHWRSACRPVHELPHRDHQVRPDSDPRVPSSTLSLSTVVAALSTPTFNVFFESHVEKF